MIPFDVLALLPPPGRAPADEARACLGLLDERLRASGRGRGHVLALTFFVDARDRDAYRARKDRLLSLVREAFGPAPPPATIVAQPPEGGRHMVLEATVLAVPAPGVRVSRRVSEGISYTVVARRGTRQVHAGGVCSPADGGADTAVQAKEAFARMRRLLRRERMTFSHLVRQWSYIERLLDIGGTRGGRGRQAYQAFNDVRTLSYGRCGFPAGYPAATGIGQAAGGVVLEFIALRSCPGVEIIPLSNPRQVDAYRYSPAVLVSEPLRGLRAKTAPKFERGKRVSRGADEAIFVSGTAAILGEKSAASGDVGEQTRTTIENIAALVGGERLSHLRAYVKRASDIAEVRRVCESAYGPIPALYVEADICREELLVELEGALVRAPGAGKRRRGAPARAKSLSEVPAVSASRRDRRGWHSRPKPSNSTE